MPSKAGRAASRQARLSRKKRRGGKGRQDFELGPEESVATTEAAVEDADIEAQGESGTEESLAAQPGATATATATRARPRTRTPTRTRKQRVSEATPARVYQYIGAELRLIGIITVIIVALLTGLTFVLG